MNMQLRLQAQMQTKAWKNAQLNVHPCTPASNSSVSSSSSCQNINDHNIENQFVHSSISHGVNHHTVNNSYQNAKLNISSSLPYESKCPDVNLTHANSKPQYKDATFCTEKQY